VGTPASDGAGLTMPTTYQTASPGVALGSATALPAPPVAGPQAPRLLHGRLFVGAGQSEP
jgi:hypothetical protein